MTEIILTGTIRAVSHPKILAILNMSRKNGTHIIKTTPNIKDEK